MSLVLAATVVPLRDAITMAGLVNAAGLAFAAAVFFR